MLCCSDVDHHSKVKDYLSYVHYSYCHDALGVPGGAGRNIMFLVDSAWQDPMEE